jgi:hypothetical protein
MEHLDLILNVDTLPLVVMLQVDQYNMQLVTVVEAYIEEPHQMEVQEFSL